jgi:hypothetical protein
VSLPVLDSIVHVWPHPGASVYEDINARPLRRLPPEGKSVKVSHWILSLLRDGSLHTTDPSPKPAAKPAAPVKE